MYHEGSRRLQDRFDTRRLADRLAAVKVRSRFTGEDRVFIEALDLFFLATADADGQPTCSYKGGDPGFVRVLDEERLVFPGYDGNGMFLSMGNVLVNPRVGLLFIDFRRPRRLRVEGTAVLHPSEGGTLRWSGSPAALPEEGVLHFPGAQYLVEVRAEQIFPNCPRYIHRAVEFERSPFVPRGGRLPPVPEWKRQPWARDVLPEGDPARRDPGEG
jgi:uncharacterized protein